MIYFLNKIRLFILKNIYENNNMGILSFDKLSFVVGLGITLLLCGLIMFYVKQKFSVYDRAITEQSQLLKHLVSSIQMSSSQTLSADGAVHSARRAHDIFGGVTNNDSRIVVSDDDGDDDGDEENCDNDSDSDTVSDDSSSDDSSSDDDEDDDNISGKTFNILDNIKVVSVDDLRLSNETKLVDEISNVNIDTEETNIGNDINILNTDELNFDENGELIEKETFDNENLDNLLEKRKYVELNKSQLQDLCKERNLSIKGSKKDLIDRLME